MNFFRQENEICLDTWDPDSVTYTDNDEDDDSEEDSQSSGTPVNIPVVLKENPPYLDDIHDVTDESAETTSRRGSSVQNEGVKHDPPSEPWFNPKFQKQETELCSTYPIRRYVITPSYSRNIPYEYISSVLSHYIPEQV